MKRIQLECVLSCGFAHPILFPSLSFCTRLLPPRPRWAGSGIRIISTAGSVDPTTDLFINTETRRMGRSFGTGQLQHGWRHNVASSGPVCKRHGWLE